MPRPACAVGARPFATHASGMGMFARLLFTRFLPSRFAWVIAAYGIGRILSGRRQVTTTTTRKTTATKKPAARATKKA